MWFKAIGIFFALLFVVFVFLMGAQSQWLRRSQQLVDDFYRTEGAAASYMAAGSSFAETFQPDRDLAGLPAPVAAYLRKVLQPGQPLIRDMVLAQKGTINLSPEGHSWKPFTAEQHIRLHSPAFIWHADVVMAPGISTFVIDAYNQGEGWLKAKMMGLVTVASQSGTGDIAEGELMRFLAESAWYPTRLLPSQGVHWQEIDSHQAMATLSVSGKTISLMFTFNDDDLIESVSSRERFRYYINGEAIHAPWQGRFFDYRTVDGMLLPHQAEVSWQLNNRWSAYWRGEIEQWHIRFSDTP